MPARQLIEPRAGSCRNGSSCRLFGYGWVGEGAPKVVTKGGFSSTTLALAKAAGIVVVSKELIALPQGAEAVLREATGRDVFLIQRPHFNRLVPLGHPQSPPLSWPPPLSFDDQAYRECSGG